VMRETRKSAELDFDTEKISAGLHGFGQAD